MYSAPCLETPRLLLRSHKQADFDAYAGLVTSARAAHMGRQSRRQAWYSFAAEVGHWALTGFGPFAIECKESKALVGQISILKHEHFPETELGWMLFNGYEGKGLAFEAASVARKWALENKDIPSLVSYIGPQNPRSIALATRLGATLDPSASPADPGDLVYRHT